jgi:hypothetical protein
VDVKNPLNGSTFIMDVVLSSGISEISCYGSKLSDDGIMWLCLFGLNMIVGCDLKSGSVVHEFQDIPCPNDLCFDHSNQNIIFVAGGAEVDMDISEVFSSALDKKSKEGGDTAHNSIDDKDGVMVPTNGQIFKVHI